MPARIVQWISRDEIGWDAVYAEQLPRVFNFFRYRCANLADAEDLTSITFEKAWRGRDRYRRDKGAFSTWLFTIARNAAVDHYRARTPAVPRRRCARRAGDSPAPAPNQPEAEFCACGTIFPAHAGLSCSTFPAESLFSLESDSHRVRACPSSRLPPGDG